MNDQQLLVAHATKLALLALLVGMVARGRVRHCWLFAVYVVATLTGNTLASMWPDRFLTAPFWLMKQSTYDLLKVALALELAYRAFASFPGAWRIARTALAAVLVASTAVLVAIRPHGSFANVYDWQPSVTSAAIWLLTATALLVVWYQIPIHDWQRAIMLGLAPYLLVFATLMSLLKRRGWSFGSDFGTLDASAYLLLVSFWAYAAWRRDSVPAVAPLSQPVSADA